MSKWTPMVSGRATSAALRGALRRCRRMAVVFLRMASPPGRTGHDDGDRASIGVPKKCQPEVSLLAPCRAGFVPPCGVKKLPARHTMRGAGSMGTSLISNGLSAMSSIKSRTPRRFLENFSLSSGTARERGSRRHTEKYFAWGWWTTMAEVDCSGSSWSSSERVMPISSARSKARSASGRRGWGRRGSRRSGPTSISNNRSWCTGRSPRCGSVPLDRISDIAPSPRDATVDR